jgi:hypothetical protein
MEKNKVSRTRIQLTLRRSTVIPLTDLRLALAVGGIVCGDSGSCQLGSNQRHTC